MDNRSGSFTVISDTNSNHAFAVRLTENGNLVQERPVSTRGQAMDLIEAFEEGRYNPQLLNEQT